LHDLFDVKVFIRGEINIERLAQRHLEAGIVATLEQGIERVMANDKPNGLEVVDGTRYHGVLII
jgi:hypothetical protein